MKYIRILLIAVILIGSLGLAGAQNQVKPGNAIPDKNKKVHSPRKATLYSAVLPGLGQIYNKKYWKVPIIYGGFVGFAYAINWNNDKYVTYKQAYADIKDNDPKTNSFLELEYAKNKNLSDPGTLAQFADALSKAKDSARRYRDLNVIFTAAFYALNMIDASVDGHFFNFDISEDLSMVWAPGTIYCMDNKMIGVRCQVTF